MEIDLNDAKSYITDMTNGKINFTTKSQKKIDGQIMKVWNKVKEGFEDTHLDLNEDLKIGKEEKIDLKKDQPKQIKNPIGIDFIIEETVDNLLENVVGETYSLSNVTEDDIDN